MRKYPEKSEIAVFRDLSELLSELHRKYHLYYRKDRLLKDQLVATADVQHVARYLREKYPQHRMTRSQDRISVIKSAGAYSIATTDGEEGAYYGLGQGFRGPAERRICSYGRRVYHRNYTRKRLAMRKGCWVYGKTHIARKHHSDDEIEQALKKHKKKDTYICVEDVWHILYINEDENGDEQVLGHENDEENGGMFIVEDGEDSCLLADEVYEINRNLETQLANKSFL